MKKIVLILAVMISIALLMVGGCKKEEVATNQTVTGAFIGGSEGLTLSFLPGSPPDEVFDTEDYPFDINLKVENQGEFTVPAGKYKVDIIGIDPDDFNEAGEIDLTDGDSTEDLIQKRIVQGQTITGTSSNIAFTNLDYDGKVTGSAQFIVRADMCYLYQTKANSKICILKNLLTPTGTRFCEPNAMKTAENSGAPVKIGNLEETVTGKDKIAYTFIVKHVGTGMVFKKSETQQCSEISDKNKVQVTVNGGFSSGLSCSGLTTNNENIAVGEVRMFGEEGSEQAQVRCTQTLENPQDLEKVVEITLDYDYNVYTDKTLKVTHVPE